MPVGHIDVHVADLAAAGEFYDAYGPGYYAVFFEDPSGNPLEVYIRT